jgi:tetratricopeptide (TPR) repeat protein
MDALKIDVSYAPAWRGLGDLFRESGEFQQALHYYQESVRLRPQYADAYTGMGVVLKELKRKAEAEQCFETVVQLRPSCALSLGNLAGRRGLGMKCNSKPIDPKVSMECQLKQNIRCRVLWMWDIGIYMGGMWRNRCYPGTSVLLISCG